jgi:Fe-coproporphyrin III synthase
MPADVGAGSTATGPRRAGLGRVRARPARLHLPPAGRSGRTAGILVTQLTPRPTAQPAQERGDVSPLLPPREPITDLPIVILQPHSRCNCRCVMCDIWQITTKQEIAPEDVERWLPEWRTLGVRRVVLSGGEALMHSRLWPMCEALRSADIGITILSTGILLRRHAGNIVRYCDDVVVSLDGPRQIHDSIRRIPGAFGKLMDGVRAVRDADQLGGVRISGRSVVQQANYRYLRATVAAAHETGLDRISFLAVDVSTDAFNRPGGWAPDRVARTALAEEDLPVLVDELTRLEEEHRADFDSGFIAESPLKLQRRLYQYFRALLGNGDFYPVECNAPWVSSLIETDGTVRPCFFQPALGNIYQSGSLEAVINSPSASAWRKGLDTHRNEICRRCVCSLSLRGDGHAATQRSDPWMR